MSRFYGSLRGQARTEATRRGSAKAPVYAHVRGWNIGGSVEVYVGPNGEDRVCLCLTSGSNGHTTSRELGDFCADDLK